MRKDPSLGAQARLSAPSTASFLRVIGDIVTFRNMSVGRRFLMFTAGVSLWYVVIGAIGIAYQPHLSGVLAITAALIIAHVLLIAFSLTATRSFTVPIGQINRQIREMSSGELTSLAHIKVSARDEVGELTSRFNGLLDALRELQTFRTVIEQDDSLDDVFGRLERVFREKGLPHFQILVPDSSGRGLRPARQEGPPPRWCAPVLADSALQCRAFKTASTVASEFYPEICKVFGSSECNHYCFPLILGGKVAGIVQVVHQDAPGDSPEEWRTRIDIVHRFVHEALPVLEARRLTETLRESAMRDGLTGLYNRRFMEEMIVQVTALVRRRKSSLGVVMCDIDHFKKVNDVHGHAVGDQVLRQVATRLAEAARESDLSIRYGGEEFLLLLHDTDTKGAALTAERVRTSIRAQQIDVPDGTTLRVTVSLGVASFPADGDSFAEVLRLADEALYRAKAEGRDRVVAGPGVPRPDSLPVEGPLPTSGG